MAKQLHFNKNGEALKRMQAGVDKLASVVGVTLGPKVGAASQAPAVWGCHRNASAQVLEEFFCVQLGNGRVSATVVSSEWIAC